jgi:hypothetical protein
MISSNLDYKYYKSLVKLPTERVEWEEPILVNILLPPIPADDGLLYLGAD